MILLGAKKKITERQADNRSTRRYRSVLGSRRIASQAIRHSKSLTILKGCYTLKLLPRFIIAARGSKGRRTVLGSHESVDMA